MKLKNHTFSINYINKDKLSKIISLIFSFNVFIHLYFKNISLNNTYFDLGIYYSQLIHIQNGDFWIILFGHLSPFILFLFLLKKVLFFLDISLVLILLTTAIYYFSSRLFYLYFSIKVQIIFLFFFPVFNIILHDFHIEIIIIPLVISALYQIQKKNYNKGLFYTSLIFLTKITLYPSIFSIAIYFFIHGKRKIFYSLSLILFLIFFTYYFFIRNE